MIVRFFSFFIKPTFAIVWRLIYFCFSIVGPYGFVCAARRDSVSFLRFPFFSRVQVFSCEISLVCRLECPYSCFSSYFCFLVNVVLLNLVLFVAFLVTVIVVSCCCNCSCNYYFTRLRVLSSLEIFTTALADGFPLESPHVSKALSFLADLNMTPPQRVS